MASRSDIAKAAAWRAKATARIAALENALAEHERRLRVRTVMDWVEQAVLHSSPLVSVVLPTRNRRDLLRRAIASVENQTYANWELLIVDDASSDGTRDVLGEMADARIRCLRGDGNGVCAARNVALAQARGELIAYLDDDNLMDRGWLKSIVWAMEQQPETKVIYAAFVVDDPARINPAKSGELPRLYFFPYDHHAVAVDNIADMGRIAHRAGLAEAHFDEGLREMGDWDLFLRLTRERPPLALPVIACFYTTDAPGRLSYGPTREADLAAVRRKNRR
ncbi:MAG: glycosyltransferase family 2 protein [Methyloceanibacter sp.]